MSTPGGARGGSEELTSQRSASLVGAWSRHDRSPESVAAVETLLHAERGLGAMLRLNSVEVRVGVLELMRLGLPLRMAVDVLAARHGVESCSTGKPGAGTV